MMHITIEHYDGKYPSFNVSLHTREDKEPFLVIKGCRIVDGQKGPFVSWPAKKQDNGKYWNHVYASEDFAAVVMNKANEAQQKAKRAAQPARQARPPSGFDDMYDDIPW